MYLVRPPSLFRLLYPSLTWKIETDEKVIYLTFDDGPIPDVTEFVLKTLDTFSAKATFFCIGENIAKHPEIFKNIVSAGHSIGNHTYNHLKGWDTETEKYLENTEQCQALTQTDLFRPPYGRIKHAQIRGLRRRLDPKLRIIMWDVLSADYDQSTSPEKCLKNVLKFTQPGSIVVFHDSTKAARNMKYALPETLLYFSKKGFRFEAL